jgi:hypothetical protein
MAIYDFFQQDSYKNLADNYNNSVNDIDRPKVSSINMQSIDPLFQDNAKALEANTMNQTPTFENPDENNGKKSFTNSKFVNIASGVGQMIPQRGATEGQPEGVTKTSNAMNSTKDAVGKAIPIAGMFRGIEKGVVQAAGKTSGDKGAAISQAMFSPSDSIAKIAGDPDMTGGEKLHGYLNVIFNPIGAGVIIDKANQKRKQKALEMQNYRRKTEQEKQYNDAQEDQSLKQLENVKNAQMNYITKFNY